MYALGNLDACNVLNDLVEQANSIHLDFVIGVKYK